MLAGPLFAREWQTVPRRPRFYITRAAYVGLFFVLLWTTWQAMIGFEREPSLGEIARFSAISFELFSYTQLALVLFSGALFGAGTISIEKDRRTFILLLVTRLADSEIVLGKFAGALLQVGSVLAASLPVFFAVTLFGGVSFVQVGQVFAATVGGALLSISLGVLIATWRDKTFQSIALTILGVVLSLLVVETAVTWASTTHANPHEVNYWAANLSTVRAVAASIEFDPTVHHFVLPGVGHLLFGILFSCLTLGTSILNLRRWNPRGETIQQREVPDAGNPAASTGFVRHAWSNPVLWREIRTRAYGSRPFVIKLAYLVIAGLLLAGLVMNPPEQDDPDLAFSLARTIVPVGILSLILINAQAVASITTERDLKSLDLLLVTDVTPPEFIFGKIWGICFNIKEMLIAPLVMFGVATWMGLLDVPNLIYTSISFLTLAAFASVLGIHSGLRHDTSRSAIINSLGTIFLLFVGVLICLYLIVISGRFEAQWAAFVLFIILGSIGLWVSLTANAPSGAITLTASIAPAATFYCIIAFVVGDRFSPFGVVVATYAFAVTAMLVPMLSEFDVATGRTSVEGD